MTDPRVRIELEAVSGMIESLDYYQVLRVSPQADRKTLERAFVAESRKFHPDRFRGHNDAEIDRLATKIFRRLSEAWSVLRDSQLRAAYDRRRSQGGSVDRITKADLEAESLQGGGGVGAGPSPQAKTGQAKKYVDTALQAERKGDLRGALMQAQFAAMAEPSNESLKAYVEALKARMAED